MLRHLSTMFQAPRVPSLADVRHDGIMRRPPDSHLPNGKLLWGPISQAQAQLAGAHAPTSSVLMRPVVDPDVRSAALMEVPHHAWQRVHDTADALRGRLGASTFFEDSHVFKGGRLGKKRVRLNETEYPQPRRRSWSVLVAAAHEDGNGDTVQTLLNYTAAGRAPSDWRSRAMPAAVYELGVHAAVASELSVPD